MVLFRHKKRCDPISGTYAFFGDVIDNTHILVRRRSIYINRLLIVKSLDDRNISVVRVLVVQNKKSHTYRAGIQIAQTSCRIQKKSASNILWYAHWVCFTYTAPLLLFQSSGSRALCLLLQLQLYGVLSIYGRYRNYTILKTVKTTKTNLNKKRNNLAKNSKHPFFVENTNTFPVSRFSEALWRWAGPRLSCPSTTRFPLGPKARTTTKSYPTRPSHGWSSAPQQGQCGEEAHQEVCAASVGPVYAYQEL